MTDGLPNHSDEFASRCATAADAAELQLAEAPNSKEIAEPLPFACLPATNYARLEARVRRGGLKAALELLEARAIVEHSLAIIAADKNVAVAPTLSPVLIEVVLGTFTPANLAGFIRGKPDCVKHAATAMNHALDMVAAAHFIRIMRLLDGWNEEDVAMVEHSRHWAAAMPANDCPDTRWRWPTSQDFIATYRRARSSGPVSIRFPGAIRAAYQFDPAFRLQSSTSYPPVIRCMAAPGNIGFVMDGHWRKPEPGGVLETWWRNGNLHRDLSEGPALIGREYSGAIVDEQYWIHGQQQPSPETDADG